MKHISHTPEVGDVFIITNKTRYRNRACPYADKRYMIPAIHCEYKKTHDYLVSLKLLMIDEQDYETAASLRDIERNMFLKISDSRDLQDFDIYDFDWSKESSFSIEEFNIRLFRAIQSNKILLREYNINKINY